ncbi:hypothetical protein DIJ64_03515 [Mycobacterium leprae]|uniref:AB hydrolase-1 domain-containing protein n=1 Tax=Mycobacterium leprae TaxID=1769 RepID=A0AAD0KQF2_MYCLR|nr:hypothetical protein [Mycobacterium leprae]AWV47492.1 hypothetical protein DIJ64_03515 [Mycobacterium leprae]OAR21684.1 hypothetical protein A8144_00245 [Mycobacterium leprae 3125609]OAX72222.1 hypothetical protein A3216_00305 [Mycobacterium leprae 7935681]
MTLTPHERALLAGHSMGGITIFTWPDCYRDKVHRLADAGAVINTTTGDRVRKAKLAIGFPASCLRLERWLAGLS